MNIMKKISLALALCCASFYSMADQLSLGGFSYGPMEAPTGKEWESPENLALNKEQPHAYIFPFQDVESARKVLPENSKFWQSLDGDWKFNWAPDPDSRPKDFYKTEFDVSGWDNIPVPSSWNIYGVQKDGSLKYGVPIYVNQPVIFQHKVAVDDWRGGVMRTPPANWTTYKHRNEVGSFRRNFEIPQDWDGREVFISFDGVDSFFYLWDFIIHRIFFLRCNHIRDSLVPFKIQDIIQFQICFYTSVALENNSSVLFPQLFYRLFQYTRQFFLKFFFYYIVNVACLVNLHCIGPEICQVNDLTFWPFPVDFHRQVNSIFTRHFNVHKQDMHRGMVF